MTSYWYENDCLHVRGVGGVTYGCATAVPSWLWIWIARCKTSWGVRFLDGDDEGRLTSRVDRQEKMHEERKTMHAAWAYIFD